MKIRRTTILWWCQSASVRTLRRYRPTHFLLFDPDRGRVCMCMCASDVWVSERGVRYPRYLFCSHHLRLLLLFFGFVFFFIHYIDILSSFSYKLICCHYYFATYVFAKKKKTPSTSGEKGVETIYDEKSKIQWKTTAKYTFSNWWDGSVCAAVETWEQNPMYFAVVYLVFAFAKEKD